MMRDIIKRVLDKAGVMDDQDFILDTIQKELTEGGYVHIDSIKLDPERVILAVSKIMNELQEERPFMLEG
jgi:hypothetical protein